MYKAYDDDGNFLGSYDSYDDADDAAGEYGYVVEDEETDFSTFDYDYMV